MPNIWHLTHRTPLFKPHEVFQMCQNFTTCYNTMITLHGTEQYSTRVYYYFIHLSLSFTQTLSLSLSLSLSHLELLLFAHHFFSLTDLTKATDFAKVADSSPISLPYSSRSSSTTPSSLSFPSSLILKPLKPISPNAT